MSAKLSSDQGAIVKGPRNSVDDFIFRFGAPLVQNTSLLTQCYVERGTFASGELWLKAFSETLSAAK